MSETMRVYVARPDEDPVPACRVAPATYDRLRLLGSPYGWVPMVSESEGTYRAWLRNTNGNRLFGRPAGSAEEAAQKLLAKVTPMVRG
jgi:hypothetical protein